VTPALQAKNSAPTTSTAPLASTAAAPCCLSHSHVPNYCHLPLAWESEQYLLLVFGAERTRNFEVNTPAINLCIHCSRNSIYAAIKNRETPKNRASGMERGRERDGDRRRLADCILNPLNGLCLGVIGGNGSGSGCAESQMKCAGGTTSMLVSQLKNMNAPTRLKAKWRKTPRIFMEVLVKRNIARNALQEL